MKLRKIDGHMGLIERLRILLKYQGENIKSGVSRIGNYTGLFILYPFILWSFFTTMNTSELSLNLSKSIFYIGLIVWGAALLLTVIDCLKKNQFLVGLSTCLMYIYGIFTLPISSTAAWGEGRLNFVALQEVSIILWPMIYFISEYYYIYLAWGLEVTFSVYLVAIWQYVFYPLRHKSDLAVASEVQSQTVDALSDTLQEQHFDKDEIKED